MRIGIDISPLNNDHKTRGVGFYTKELINSLQKYEKSHEFVLFDKQNPLPGEVDLIHLPFFDPFWLTCHRDSRIPTVVTVHDLIPLVYPDHFPRGLRGEIKWQIQRYNLRGAEQVITDSQASKVDIGRIVPYPADRISVIYLAPSAEYFEIEDRDEKAKVLRKYNLPEKFFLYVGDVNWNKNLPGLLRAYAQSRSGIENPAVELVLVGKAFLEGKLPEARFVNSEIDNLGLNRVVHKLGFVSAADLRVLYSHAAATILVSFAEGFGLPVLEAMACGSPVVASAASSLKEIAGPTLQVNPESVADMTSGLIAALHDNRSARRQRLDWARKFSWEKVAQETVAVYTKVFYNRRIAV